jgi:hypothetical protein
VDAVVEALRPRMVRYGYDEKLSRAQIARAIFC